MFVLLLERCPSLSFHKLAGETKQLGVHRCKYCLAPHEPSVEETCFWIRSSLKFLLINGLFVGSMLNRNSVKYLLAFCQYFWNH